jgi:PPK2 family polyphosphate:nucleotide phosphotransferase
MPVDKAATDKFLIQPGTRVRLKNFDPAWCGNGPYKRLGREILKAKAEAILRENQACLAEAQGKLWAANAHSVLVILQAMDAAGKDGVVKHVMSGMNPQGCSVTSFKQPSTEELDHNFLWRIWKNVPSRGQIMVFNRSHYEDVLITRVHPELLHKALLPGRKIDREFWAHRYEEINNFEKHLARSGTLILKFFLHLTKGEQKRRFLERIENPEKNWKFSASDVTERQYWDDYMDAYEQALTATSTKWAPWYVIPADHKFVARAAVADILRSSIEKLDLQWPKPSREQLAGLADAKAALSRQPR